MPPKRVPPRSPQPLPHEVVDDTAAVPKAKRRRSIGRTVALAIASVIAAWFAFISIVTVVVFKSEPTKAEQVGAEELSDAFQTNEVRAEQKYKGRVLDVRGTVKRIRSGMFGPEIDLDHSRNLFKPSVTCSFRRSEQSVISNVDVGDLVVIRGKCVGNGLLGVSLDECTFAPIRK